MTRGALEQVASGAESSPEPALGGGALSVNPPSRLP